MLQFEAKAGGNIKPAEDALWAAATITMVGYGDRYPVTSEGRLVAVTLMCVGMGLFGTFSGLLAAWFIAPGESATDRQLAELRRDVRELRGAVENGGQRAAADRQPS